RFSSWEETCRFAANLVRQRIEAENPESVAAFLVEPICNVAGIITPTAEYYRIIRKACDDYNVILIFDEVLTGIGKTGDMFAAQTYGVTPDIICSGKGLSSGMLPMGSMIAREDMADAFRGENHRWFGHGHTYANFPLGCAVATEVINIIEELKLCERARVIGNYLRTRLEKLKDYGVVREVRGLGTLLGVELEEDPVNHRPFPNDRMLGNALKKTARANGVILRISPDWFAVSPPLISTDEEIEELCNRIEKSLLDAIELNRKN
ncbi:MAG: aminotransferase class III-fold pyridoxal phosphate-dependent enzyme, partial [Eubacteriales bacterium]|nr:aminotransferase class III-fold pyridoxal phosphate-dependent enzyme [Eubacteriales bacterium]